MADLISPVHIQIALKLLTAMFLGMALGAERLSAHKSAGMRTYALVTLASAFFVIIADQVQAQHMLSMGEYDSLRMASQIIVGVGFLGAGLIIFKNDRVSNLTTASGLWAAAGIGMAVGFGLFAEAVFVTILALFILSILAMVERRFKEHMNAKEIAQDIVQAAPISPTLVSDTATPSVHQDHSMV